MVAFDHTLISRAISVFRLDSACVRDIESPRSKRREGDSEAGGEGVCLRGTVLLEQVSV